MTGQAEQFREIMDQGHSAAWDQSWEAAAAHYRDALEIDPENPQALNSLGLALYELQRYDEALKYYSKAATIAQDDPVPLEKVAQLSERIGNFGNARKASLRAADMYMGRRDAQKVIENLSRVTRIDPDNVTAHSKLAVIYEHLGRKQQAVIEYLAVASLMQHAGDLKKALQSIEHALKLSPSSNEAHQALSLLKESKPLPKPSRSRGATSPLQSAQVPQLEAPAASKSSRLDPIAEARHKALGALAAILFEQPENEQVDHSSTRRGLGSIVRGATPATFTKQEDQAVVKLHLNQAIDLQTRGDRVQAATELERAIEAGLEHAAAYFNLGLLRSEGERLESAMRYLQRAVKHPDYALAARLLLGQLMRQMDRTREATIEYLEALKWADAQVVPEEQADELIQLYEPIIEGQSQLIDEHEQVRLMESISELLVRKDWQENLANARKDLPGADGSGPPIPLGEILTEARSSQVVDAISSIHQLARNGHIRTAMEEAYFALQDAPTYLPLHIYLGELMLKREQLNEAIEKFTMIAQTYSVRGEANRAVELLRRIVRLAPMDLQARRRLIEQLIARGQMNEALQEYLDLAEVNYNLADLVKARETYEEALRMAQNYRIDRDLRVQIMHQIADIDLQSLDWRQAMRVYEQIRDLQLDDKRARARLIELNFRLGQSRQAFTEINNYGEYLSSAGQSDQMIPFLEELVRENPEQLDLHRRLAESYVQDGRKKEAIKQLDEVGERQLEAGDQAGAAQTIQSILALEPSNRGDYEQLLQQLKG